METNIFVFLALEMGEFFGESLNEYYENRQRKKQREKKKHSNHDDDWCGDRLNVSHIQVRMMFEFIFVFHLHSIGTIIMTLIHYCDMVR